ncbi:MAG: MFS transporter, partial [Pseudonocardia sp.]
MTTARERSATLDERSIRRIAGLSLVGASVEWFDFFLFGTAAALVFPRLFFPGENEFAGLLASFAVLGVGFVARPLGGILWGHFGDRAGRKKAFLAALMTMAVASVLIGLLPTYAAIGIAAPILLTLLRFTQGLAVGGQWGGAVLLATEFAPKHKRGFYGSFAQIGVPIGVLLGVVAFFLLGISMDQAAFDAYGWRIPFVASVVLVAVAIYAKNR